VGRLGKKCRNSSDSVEIANIRIPVYSNIPVYLYI
jgi:hypothetical protein